MKRTYLKPLVPNFIRTTRGIFPIQDFTEQELTEYAEFWCETLRKKYEQKTRKR